MVIDTDIKINVCKISEKELFIIYQDTFINVVKFNFNVIKNSSNTEFKCFFFLFIRIKSFSIRK